MALQVMATRTGYRVHSFPAALATSLEAPNDLRAGGDLCLSGLHTHGVVILLSGGKRNGPDCVINIQNSTNMCILLINLQASRAIHWKAFYN